MLKKILHSSLVSVLFLSLFTGSVSALAQVAQANSIGLSIAKVNQTQNGKIIGAEVFNPDPSKPNIYSTKAKVNPEDDIRYRWGNFLIDIKNVDAKNQPKSGYIKVYKGTAPTESEFITNAGSHLPLADISSKLQNGENTIFLQVVTNDGKPLVPATGAQFTFEFTADSSLPSIEIVSPKPGALLSDTAIQDFNIKTNNFTLENSVKSNPNSGKLSIYWDEVKPEKLIATVYRNEFKSSDFEFSKIEDGKSRSLIFVLKDGKDQPLKPSVSATLSIKANYRSTIDVGLPRVTFVQPDKTTANINLTDSSKISVKVDNFDLVDNTTDKNPEDGKGVLQVSIDNKKVADSLTQTEFSLNDLMIGDLSEGPKEIKVELVSKNFEKLNPEAKDIIKVNYAPLKASTDSNISYNQNTESPSWKIVIVILIVILIIGGIAVLITKA